LEGVLKSTRILLNDYIFKMSAMLLALETILQEYI